MSAAPAALSTTAFPAELGVIVDVAALNGGDRSVWLMLAEDGRLVRFDADRLRWAIVAMSTVPPEPGHKPWTGHHLKRRLHVSGRGECAAVVNDYGRYGKIIDLRSGTPVRALDGGEYYPETVPFSFAFADVQGRLVAIHRTAWNRLDLFDPIRGQSLSERGPTTYGKDEERPEHYLDYFHGALHVSPGGTHILDDGWIWHPVGVPTIWSLERWVAENAWESEDGPSKLNLCARDSYWDRGVAWIDDRRVAVAGIGDDDLQMIDGARVFDVTTAGEVAAFAGPRGRFFSDGAWLYSADESGLSRWDPSDGARTAHLPGFSPTHHHRHAGELVQLTGTSLVRWSLA